ncbi:hypothetical protein CBR_g24219 [Chara braunii]|uniref:Uncharacterized protein n=1 Tax=Chara braunii TaxID=69332 RepID=A0A388L6A6_CHABU|nr:hypothetical protein CBR_g24219 [Chara braunii]|eukprot:GBG77772.1 hypothetical protein CBR_g24219 [Chara braunii]
MDDTCHSLVKQGRLRCFLFILLSNEDNAIRKHLAAESCSRRSLYKSMVGRPFDDEVGERLTRKGRKERFWHMSYYISLIEIEGVDTPERITHFWT